MRGHMTSLKTFANGCKFSIQLCKTCFESQRTRYGKLVQFKSGQTIKELTEDCTGYTTNSTFSNHISEGCPRGSVQHRLWMTWMTS